MKTGLVNFRIATAMDNGSVIVRRAAKDWMCWGGHDGTKRTKCRFGQIVKGQVYVEYVGEVPAFTSGARYHPECAAQQGLLERIQPTADLNCGACYREGKGVVFGCTVHPPEARNGGR